MDGWIYRVLLYGLRLEFIVMIVCYNWRRCDESTPRGQVLTDSQALYSKALLTVLVEKYGCLIRRLKQLTDIVVVFSSSQNTAARIFGIVKILFWKKYRIKEPEQGSEVTEKVTPIPASEVDSKAPDSASNSYEKY
uniref:DDE_Tnp_1_7 domain-containing protein n=1 Tax=Syphacia muris TaxID=451379 RepID=A0A0N5AE93_9BILA